MTRFKEGNPGRPKGSKNKKTLAKKEELENLFNENGGFENLFKSINEIEEPKDKATILLKLMEFFMSKEKKVEIVGDEVFKYIQIIEDNGENSEANSTNE